MDEHTMLQNGAVLYFPPRDPNIPECAYVINNPLAMVAQRYLIHCLPFASKGLSGEAV